MPITVAVPSQKEKVNLQSRRLTLEPEPKPVQPTQEVDGEENDDIDNDDDDGSSDSGSGSESDGENGDRSRRSLRPKERSTPIASMTRQLRDTAAEREETHSLFFAIEHTDRSNGIRATEPRDPETNTELVDQPTPRRAQCGTRSNDDRIRIAMTGTCG